MSDYWHRSTFCESSSCVEVAVQEPRVKVRDSTNPDLVMIFTAAEWQAFLDGVRNGEFDL